MLAGSKRSREKGPTSDERSLASDSKLSQLRSRLMRKLGRVENDVPVQNRPQVTATESSSEQSESESESEKYEVVD